MIFLKRWLLLLCVFECLKLIVCVSISPQSSRLQRARIRLAEAQGLIPIGASENQSLSLEDVTMSSSLGSAGMRELSWRVAEPAVSYNPVEIEKELWGQPWVWLVRNVQFLVPFFSLAVKIIFDIISDSEEKNRRVRAEELREFLSAQSPALIKAGQALASRSDLLPREYLEELQKLQDRCPSFPTQDAFDVFYNEFGEDFEKVFEFSSIEPIAAASIGQVYKATIRENGAEVAIKIQRPNCLTSIAIDLYIMRWYAGLTQKILTALQRDIDLISVIDDFGELIYREIDYRAEAVNAQRFAELYSNIPDVFVPKIYTTLSTSKVLTMEWVDGARLIDEQSLQNMNIESSKMIDILVQCSLRQLLENGFFHADPHAGNLLAMENGKLCYLDFGMVSYVERSQRYSIIEAVVHLVNRDFIALAELYRRMGFIPSDVDSKPIVEALESALPDVLSAPVGELNFKNVISKLGDVMYKFPFSLPPYYISIIRCLGVLEGLAIQVDKDFRIINDAYPFVASRLLTDPSDELKAAVEKLLINGATAEPNWDRLSDLLSKAQENNDYDMNAAIERLLEYLEADGNTTLLLSLENQIINYLDSLSTDTLLYVSRVLTKTVQGGSNNELLSAVTGLLDSNNKVDIVEIFDDLGSEPPQILISLISTLQDLNNNGNLESDKLTNLVRKILRRPIVQQMLSRVIAQVSEKQAGRFVSATFGGTS